mgnify:CR=1 FL=1
MLASQRLGARYVSSSPRLTRPKSFVTLRINPFGFTSLTWADETVGHRNMKTYFAIAVLIASIAYGEPIPTRQVTNEYLTMTIPSSWELKIVAGKPGEMQMYLRIHEEPLCMTFIYAYWDGLDPRDWFGNNRYTMSGRDYFIWQPKAEKELQVVRTGPSYIISATVPFNLGPEDLSLLLNSVNTIEPK